MRTRHHHVGGLCEDGYPTGREAKRCPWRARRVYLSSNCMWPDSVLTPSKHSDTSSSPSFADTGRCPRNMCLDRRL